MPCHAMAVAGFDDFSYTETPIDDGVAWLESAPDRLRNVRMGKYKFSFQVRPSSASCTALPHQP